MHVKRCASGDDHHRSRLSAMVTPFMAMVTLFRIAGQLAAVTGPTSCRFTARHPLQPDSQIALFLFLWRIARVRV